MNKTAYNKIINKVAGPYSLLEQDDDGEKVVIVNGSFGVLTPKECCKENLIKAGLMDFLGRLKDEQVQIGLFNVATEKAKRKRCSITNFVYQSGYAPLRIVKSAGQIIAYNDELLKMILGQEVYYEIGERGEMIANAEYPAESGKKIEIYIMPVSVNEAEEAEEIKEVFGVYPWQPEE